MYVCVQLEHSGRTTGSPKHKRRCSTDGGKGCKCSWDKSEGHGRGTCGEQRLVAMEELRRLVERAGNEGGAAEREERREEGGQQGEEEPEEEEEEKQEEKRTGREWEEKAEKREETADR